MSSSSQYVKYLRPSSFFVDEAASEPFLNDATSTPPVRVARRATRRTPPRRARNVEEHGVREHRVIRPAEVIGEEVHHPGVVAVGPQSVDEGRSTVGAVDDQSGLLERGSIPSRTGAQFEHAVTRRGQRDEFVDER